MKELHFIFIINGSEKITNFSLCPCSNCVESLHYSIPSLCLSESGVERAPNSLTQNSYPLIYSKFTNIFGKGRTSRSHSRKQKDVSLEREQPNYSFLLSSHHPHPLPLSLSGMATEHHHSGDRRANGWMKMAHIIIVKWNDFSSRTTLLWLLSVVVRW